MELMVSAAGPAVDEHNWSATALFFDPQLGITNAYPSTLDPQLLLEARRPRDLGDGSFFQVHDSVEDGFTFLFAGQ
jgi:hypothetical protein